MGIMGILYRPSVYHQLWIILHRAWELKAWLTKRALKRSWIGWITSRSWWKRLASERWSAISYSGWWLALLWLAHSGAKGISRRCLINRSGRPIEGRTSGSSWDFIRCFDTLWICDFSNCPSGILETRDDQCPLDAKVLFPFCKSTKAWDRLKLTLKQLQKERFFSHLFTLLDIQVFSWGVCSPVLLIHSEESVALISPLWPDLASDTIFPFFRYDKSLTTTTENQSWGNAYQNSDACNRYGGA